MGIGAHERSMQRRDGWRWAGSPRPSRRCGDDAVIPSAHYGADHSPRLENRNVPIQAAPLCRNVLAAAIVVHIDIEDVDLIRVLDVHTVQLVAHRSSQKSIGISSSP